MPWTVPTAVLLIVAALRGVSGGSLTDAAFYESLRRAFMPKVERTLTLADHPELVAKPAAPATTTATTETGQAAPTERPNAPDEPNAPKGATRTEPTAPHEPNEPHELTESEWKARMASARAALDSDQVLFEAMQGRVNGLSTDAFNRDDPAQRAELLRQRARAVEELDRLTKQVAKDKEAIAAIEEDARKKGIPPGWIR